MFIFADFIKHNLINGFRSKTFNEVQVNLFAANYLSRGQIDEAQFAEILAEIEAIKNPPTLQI